MNELAPRVTRLEAGQEALQNNLSHLTHTVETQGKQLTTAITDLSQEQRSAIDNVNKILSERGRTSWGTLGAWAAVILAVTMYHNGLTLKPYDTSQQLHEDRIEEIEDSLNQHHQLPIHPVAKEQVLKIRQEIGDLEFLVTKLDDELKQVPGAFERINTEVVGLKKSIEYLQHQVICASNDTQLLQ
jgi:chromosome segregation ATPase